MAVAKVGVVQVKIILLFSIAMSSELILKGDCDTNNESIEPSLLEESFRNGIWLFGIHSWIFGIVDRSVAAFADSYLSAIELAQIFIASFFLVGWIFLKPETNFNVAGIGALQSYLLDAKQYLEETHLGIIKARMIELQEQHMIRQEYILPFPYLCQIYHLLNLKHLETIHNFSLNNLKVIKVNHLQPTPNGGMVKFQTILDSPVNPLRIWRQPIVEVGLILHTPYTVELTIPVYNNKYITVMFNVLPLSHCEHKLFIDIYSNLEWPKPLLQILLHFASCLTLFEDLPYLQTIAERNINRLVSSSKVSERETMWLFRRFVNLYGTTIEPARLLASHSD